MPWEAACDIAPFIAAGKSIRRLDIFGYSYAK